VQALMDELYRLGARPTEHGTAGELEATRAHLQDMRVLVAQALDTPELALAPLAWVPWPASPARALSR